MVYIKHCPLCRNVFACGMCLQADQGERDNMILVNCWDCSATDDLLQRMTEAVIQALASKPGLQQSDADMRLLSSLVAGNLPAVVAHAAEDEVVTQDAAEIVLPDTEVAELAAA